MTDAPTTRCPDYVMLTSSYVPYTSRRASQISPTVAYARTHSTMQGMVLASLIRPSCGTPGVWAAAFLMHPGSAGLPGCSAAISGPSTFAIAGGLRIRQYKASPADSPQWQNHSRPQ